jgi:hypothetical protein
MKKHVRATTLSALGLGCFVLLPVTAQADVTVHKMVLFEEGLTGITSHTTDETDYIQGDKKREDDLRKFTGSVLGSWQRFRGENNGSASVDIYLVGQNQHYDMDPSKKTYSLSAIYDPQQPENGDHPEKQGQQQPDKSDTKVTKNVVTVKETGQKKNINGFDTVEYLITWEVDTQNTKTGETGKDLMTADLWNTTDSRLAKAAEEEASYSKAYLKLKRIPVTHSGDAYQFGLDGLNVSIDSADSKEFTDKLHTIKGHNVLADVRWEMSGADANGKQTNTANNDVQSSSQSLDSALGSLLGSKPSSSDSNNSKPAGTPGMTTIFHSNIEVKSVDLGSIAASQFAPPADYQKD